VTARAEEFARRRVALQLQCALQREQFAQSAAEIGADLKVVDHGINLVRKTRLVPIIMGLIGTVGMASRAGGVLRLLSRAWVFFNTFQRLRRVLK
jgi:hypothetical protein